MANKILLKRSSVLNKVPTTGQLDLGELAINSESGKLYTKRSSDNTVNEVGLGTGITQSQAEEISMVFAIVLGDSVRNNS